MFSTMHTESSSSSDDSDSDRILTTPQIKRLKLDVCKQKFSENIQKRRIEHIVSTDGMSFSESSSEKESGATSRDSDSSTNGSCYYMPVIKKKSPTKQCARAYEELSESAMKMNGDLEKEVFIQNESCASLVDERFGKMARRPSKCRECFKAADTNQYSCRFFKFRKLRRTNKSVSTLGFSSPFDDATQEDVKLWLPCSDDGQDLDNIRVSDDTHLNFHIARFILMHVGDQFCDLLHQEQNAVDLHLGDDKNIAWKKPMQGVREMCDVCKTTLFNFHWACGRCGFVVCIDCYKVRRNGVRKNWVVAGIEQDDWKWLKCTTRMPHELEKLMMCQTIAKDCLQKLGELVHDVRKSFGIPQACNCDLSVRSKIIPGLNKELLCKLVNMDPLDAIISHLEEQPGRCNGSAEHEARVLHQAEQEILPFVTNADVKVEDKQEDSSSDSDEDPFSHSSLRDILMPSEGSRRSKCRGSPLKQSGDTSVKPPYLRNHTRSGRASYSVQQASNNQSCSFKSSLFPRHPKVSNTGILDDVISSFGEKPRCDGEVKVMNHFVRRYQVPARASQNQLPARMMTSVMSQEMYPGVPHSWLCEGRLLRLIDPGHSGNYRIFQDQWRRGQPVIVGNMTKLLNMNIWHPDSFCNDFGEDRNDLVNCATGNVVPNRPMREFWEGFEHFSKRLKDESGNPMLLKLKDWPPGEDFAEMLPERFEDLMQALPLAEYTRRTGRLNLASCLPEFFVRPDLGPKMYNAYGSALFPSKGTTNLHLDISDAVNFMVYVGIPRDGNSDEHIQEAFKAIDEAGCDEATRRRVRTAGEMPGALWHIYHASDADKIRDLLNKVAIEQSTRLEPHHDPIHDQSWYLDAILRDRLYREYNVSGYAIVQCLGDAVFIPAGAPHQVRNLHNCVKVAEDFVSPENVSQCFHLTQEFRELSDTHTNHEDKLQIKNIIYHTIKSAVSLLLRVGRGSLSPSTACVDNVTKEKFMTDRSDKIVFKTDVN